MSSQKKARLLKRETACAEVQTHPTITLEDLQVAQELIQRRLMSLEAEFKRFLALVAEYMAQRTIE